MSSNSAVGTMLKRLTCSAGLLSREPATDHPCHAGESRHDLLSTGRIRPARLAGVIQNHPVFATAATAQSLFAGVSERDEPFFGFFDTTGLSPFTAQEATELLQRIRSSTRTPHWLSSLATPRGKARVQAIHHLSGGNPRLYIVLSDFITCQSLDELVRPFEGMVERAADPITGTAPLALAAAAQDRGIPLSARPARSRQGNCRGPVCRADKRCRPTVQAARDGLCQNPIRADANPCMNWPNRSCGSAWRSKNTRSHQPLRLIVDFLRVWYEREDLEHRLAKMGTSDSARKYFTAALEKLQPGAPSLRHELLREGLEEVRLERCGDDELETLRTLAERDQ